MSTNPVGITHDVDREYVKLTQSGQPGVIFPEFYLGKMLRAIENESYQGECYGGKIGVSSTPRSVILYSYQGAEQRVGVVMTRDQANRFLVAVRERYSDLISSYSI